VLSSVGIPPSGIALILGVDRILDMSRTAVNVCGDQVASLVMDKWVGGPRGWSWPRNACTSRSGREPIRTS